MRINKYMVDLMSSMDIHASECSSLRELRLVYRNAKNKLINIGNTDDLTLEEYHSVSEFIYYVYKRELYRLKYD